MFGRTFPIGSIKGISLQVDISWLAIFALVTWNLATSVFPTFHPEWNPSLAWSVSLAAAVLFFASVLAHELAHALIAQRNKIPIKKITLFLFGGVAHLQNEPESAKSEFAMAIGGPALSWVLGSVFLFLGALAGGVSPAQLLDIETVLSQLGPVPSVLFWLGPVNIVLGTFNLIPAFPLDGGRVLRSLLWGVSGNLLKATRYSVAVSYLLSFAFMGMGVFMALGQSVPFFGSGLLNGIWIAVIGWFVQQAARSAYAEVIARTVLADVRVETLMQRQIDSISRDMSVRSAVEHFWVGSNRDIILVKEKGEPVGVVGLDEVASLTPSEMASRQIGEVMTPLSKLEQVSPFEKASKAFRKLAQLNREYLPVVERNRLRGFLRKKDLVLWLQSQMEWYAAKTEVAPA